MKSLLIVMSLLTMSTGSYAGSIAAELDKTVGTIDDAFVYTVTVEGSLESEINTPSVAGLSIESSGRSSSHSFINGSYTKKTQFNFVIRATDVGSYTIPAIKAKIDGESAQTLPLTFKVQKAAASTADSTPPVFIERELSKKSVFQGEQVVDTIRVFHRVTLHEAAAEDQRLASFKRFEVKERRNYERIVKGRKYKVIEMKQVLIPLSSGTVTVDPFILRVRMAAPRTQQRRRRRSLFDDPFFDGMLGGRTVQRTVRSPELSLKVRARPPEGKSFSGLVGQFELKGSLTNHEVSTGDTTTLTLVLKGQGLLDGLKPIQLKLDKRIKVYPDKPSGSQRVTAENGLEGERRFVYALVPTEPGTYPVDQVSINVFVPELGTYVDLSTKLAPLVASGRAETIASAPEQPRQRQPRQVKALGEDLVSIHHGPALLVSHTLGQRDKGILGLLAFFGIAVVGLAFGARRWRSAPLSLAKERSSGAFRLFKKRTAKLAINMVEPTAIEPWEAAFKAYLGDKLDRRGTALTAKDAAQALTEKGVSQTLVAEVQSILQTMAELAYGGKAMNSQAGQGLIERLREVAEQLEAAC